jgi:hypothetical protein
MSVFSFAIKFYFAIVHVLQNLLSAMYILADLCLISNSSSTNAVNQESTKEQEQETKQPQTLFAVHTQAPTRIT